MWLRSFSTAMRASAWPQGVGYAPVMQAWQRLLGVEADRPGDRLDRQVAERVGPQLGGHLGLDLRRQRAALQELRREQLADRRHVDAVEAGGDDRRAGHADVDFPRLPAPAGSAASRTFSVVARTIESSTSSTRLPSSTSRSGVYLVSALRLRSPLPSMNVRPL